MKYIFNKITVLILIFLLSIITYFAISLGKGKKEEYIYTSMEEAKCPVIWVKEDDQLINCMRANQSDPGFDAVYDTLTVLSEDRILPIVIKDFGTEAITVSYEIRSMDRKELVDRQENIAFEKRAEEIYSEIKIENVLSYAKEYRLEITITTSDAMKLRYYTRIVPENKENARQMLELAINFSERNFDYDEARQNTVYLETDSTGNNSSLGEVNLKSSFDQLTYRGLDIEPIGIKDIRLCNYDGKMGEVKIIFTADRQIQEDKHELYEITESFVMRNGAERIYLMDYHRNMEEVFNMSSSSFTGSRIMLGIGNGDFSIEKSEAERYTAFVALRELFLVDSSEDSLVKVYTFRSGKDSGIRSNFYKHNIKIFRVDDDGNIDFLVYGYMNRGKHEAQTGISFNRYDNKKNIITEMAYIPVNISYEELENDLSKLCHFGKNELLYLKIKDKVYSLDIKNNYRVLIAQDLRDGNYAINSTQKRMAWQEYIEGVSYPNIKLLNMDTGESKELKSEGDYIIYPEGFIDEDLIVAVSSVKNRWILNGREVLPPFDTIEIMDDNLLAYKKYEKQGNYLYDISVDDRRIHFNILQKDENDNYRILGEDTIVSNVEAEYTDDYLGYYASEEKGRIYYISSYTEKVSKKIKISIPEKISYAQNIDYNMMINSDMDYKRYISYGRGKIQGIFDELSPAIKKSYDYMGTVKKDGICYYSRASTLPSKSIKNIGDIKNEILMAIDKGKMSSIKSIGLKKCFYFISADMPVLSYNDRGESLLIYGYDRYNISIYNIDRDEYSKLGIEEADSMFKSNYNDFSCFFTVY